MKKLLVALLGSTVLAAPAYAVNYGLYQLDETATTVDGTALGTYENNKIAAYLAANGYTTSGGSTGSLSTFGALDCRNFGCVGDGTLHKVSDSVASGGLGVSTAAAVQAYAMPSSSVYSGQKLYAFLNTASWTKSANEAILTSTSNNTLQFGKTITVSAVDSNNNGHILMAAGGLNGLRPGFIVTPLSSSKGMTGTYTLSQMATQGTDGVNNGFLLNSTPNVAPTVGDTFTVAEPLAYIQTALSAGLTVSVAGANIPSGDTITAVNQTTGVATLSASLSGTVSAFDGVDITIPYSDAEVAAMSMSSLGINAGIYYAATHNGGQVSLPPGNFYLNQTVTLAPVNEDYPGTYLPVDLVGSGEGATRLTALTDLGWGQYLVSCPLRITGGANCFGKLKDMQLQSINTTQTTGASPTLMGGIGWSGRRQLDNLRILDMGDAVAVTGDQTHFSNVEGFGNYDCFHWDYNNTYNSHDNFVVTKAICGNNANAAIDIGPNVVIAGSLFDFFTDGAGPFGIEKETGGNQASGLSDDIFNWPQFENVGIAARGEDRPWLNHASNDTRVDYNMMEYQRATATGATQFNSPYGLGNSTAAFDENAFVSVKVEPSDTYNWGGSAEGALNVNDASFGADIHGDIVQWLSNVSAVFGPVATNPLGWNFDDRNWHAYVLNTSQTFTIGKLACNVISAVATGGTSAQLGPCGGTSGDDPLGIVLAEQSSGMNLVLDRGLVSLNSTGFTLTPTASSNGSTYPFYVYGPQGMCTSTAGGIQPALGRTCPNGGTYIGQVDASGSPLRASINVQTH